MKKKVLIIDDEPDICDLVRALIEWERLDLSLLGMLHDGESAYQTIRTERPDIVITDIQIPGITGL